MENNIDITTLSPVLQDMFTFLMEKAVLHDGKKQIAVGITGTDRAMLTYDCFKNDLTILVFPEDNAIGFTVDWYYGANTGFEDNELDDHKAFEPITERLLEICEPLEYVTVMRHPDVKDVLYDEDDTMLDFDTVCRYIELIIERHYYYNKLANKR